MSIVGSFLYFDFCQACCRDSGADIVCQKCQTPFKLLRKFLELNDGIRKIIVTTKTKLGSSTMDGNTFLFIPSALYAYWVSKYLFEEKAHQILLPEINA